jgi:hypothetical protein
MALKPEISLPVAAATAALVWAVYQTHMPNVADVRGAAPNNGTIDTSRKITTWEAAGIVSAISLIAKDPTVFIIGGAMVVMLDFTHRHANATHPNTGQLVGPTAVSGS